MASSEADNVFESMPKIYLDRNLEMSMLAKAYANGFQRSTPRLKLAAATDGEDQTWITRYYFMQKEYPAPENHSSV